MTPGQARVALLSFLLVTIGVAVNALFLQARPGGAVQAALDRAPISGAGDAARRKGEAARPGRPAPYRTASIVTQTPLRIARFAPDSARLDSEPALEQGASGTTIAAIQRELSARGYGPLAPDGVMGLGTRTAIIAFEHDHGMPLSGEASEALLRRILLEGSGGPAARANAGSGEPEQTIRTVQKGLAALGYPIGHVDGRLGEDTVKAIRDFELDRGLVPKGRISAELVTQLGEATAARPAAR
jgi:peptidoglycan hydrolase-like protein with peptidoglycan-binding domain